MALVDGNRSADDGTGLHDSDLRIGDSQTAATVTHHRVELVETLDESLDLFNGLALGVSEFLDVSFFGRNELVERRIEEADGDRHTFEGFVELLEVFLLHGKDLLESFFTLFLGGGADHLAEGVDAAFGEEHVLGTAEADAFCAKLTGLTGIFRSIGIGTDLHGSEVVRPAHEGLEVLVFDGTVENGKETVVDVAGGTVEGDGVAFFVGLTAELEGLVLLVHDEFGAAGDTAGTHAAGNDRRVRGHTAAGSQDALCSLHAFNVFGRGLETDENDFLAAGSPFDRVLSGEDDFTGSSAGGSRKAFTDLSSTLDGSLVEGTVKQGVEVSRVDRKDGSLFGDLTFPDEVVSDLQSSLGGTLTVTGLEHVEFTVFDGELHVLHVSVVVLKFVSDAEELIVDLRHGLFDGVDVHRSTDTGNDVFALGVHQNFREELVFTGSRVTGERNTGTGGVTHVAEGHHLDVDRGTPGIRDVVVTSVNVRTGVVPGTENSFDCFEELDFRVRREFFADLVLVLFLELEGEFLEVLSVEVDVLSDALLLFHVVDELLEIFLADFHDDVGEHLDETSVAVPGPTRVAGLLGEGLNDFFVQTEVQDGVHHAGHGCAGTGTNGNEKRVLFIAKLLAGDLFQFDNSVQDLGLDIAVDLTAIFIVLSTGFGGDGETLRNRKTKVGHFCKVRTLTAEDLTHVCVTFAEKVDIFLCHNAFPSAKNWNRCLDTAWIIT